MPLTDADVLDLAKTTQKELGRGQWTQIVTKLQDFEFWQRILRPNRPRLIESAGGIEHRIAVDGNTSARMVGLHPQDDVNIGDHFQTITVPWRRITANYGWERREMLENGTGAQRLVDLMDARRKMCMIGIAELLEDQFWSKPTDSTDKLSLWGALMWIVKSTGSFDFNGGNPTGFSDGVGGLSSSTYTNWANGTASYTDIDKNDLLPTMRTAHRKCGWKSPVTINEFRYGSGDSRRYYTNDAVYVEFEKVGENQNENLGRDLAPMGMGSYGVRHNSDGALVFKGHAIIPVAKLDADTDNPIYQFDWDVMAPFFLKGDYMRETDPIMAANGHNSFAVHFDMSFNLISENRRRTAVFKAA